MNVLKLSCKIIILFAFVICLSSCEAAYQREIKSIKSRVSDFSMFIGGDLRYSWVDFYPEEIIRQINAQGQSSMVMNQQTQLKYLGSPVASPDDVKVLLRGHWARITLKIPNPWSDKIGEYWYKHRGKWYVWDKKVNTLGILKKFSNPPFSETSMTEILR